MRATTHPRIVARSHSNQPLHAIPLAIGYAAVPRPHDRHADFLSLPFALIAAISIGPRLNSPLPAFLVKSRR